MPSLLFILTLLLPQVAVAGMTAQADDINGFYQMGSPEQGRSRLQLGLAQLGPKKVLVAMACAGCPPAIYRYLPELSASLKRPVFLEGNGRYLIGYDSQSFVVVQTEGELGSNRLGAFIHTNIYSRNRATAASVDSRTIEVFATELSESLVAN